MEVNSPQPAQGAAAKRTVEERSPQVDAGRNVRQRLNEFDMGQVFEEIEARMRRRAEEVVEGTPVEMKESMRKGMEAMLTYAQEVMSSLSDGIRQERMEREVQEMKVEDRLEKVETKMEELKATADSLTRNRLRIRTRDSIRDMEKQVMEAQAALKLLDVNIGRVTGDRREIVRSTVEEIRHYVKEEDLRYFDTVMRRTRIIIMGKQTARWENGNNVGFSVPTLFQCRDRRDQEELESILRSAGYFPSFHWPKAMMNFVEGVREEVRRGGARADRFYIRVRPDTRNGKLVVKAEVKPKDGQGRFVVKGFWACPPLDPLLWDDIPDLYTPLGRSEEAS